MSESLKNLAASRPIQVKYAVILIAASVATGIAESMLHLANGATNGTFASGTYGGPSFLLAMLLFTFVGIFMTIFTYLRNKWAWMLAIASCLLVIPSIYALLLGEGLGKEFPMAEHFFGSTSNTLYLLATLLLLATPSRRWFLRR